MVFLPRGKIILEIFKKKTKMISLHRSSFHELKVTKKVTLNKAFRHVETLFVHGNHVCTDQTKAPFLLSKKVCFDQYELDYLGRMKFLHVEMPYCTIHTIFFFAIFKDNFSYFLEYEKYA